MTKQYAMLFPGQGSQSTGMLSAMAERFPVVRETYQEASDQLGFDLWQLVQEGPEEQLNSTENTQPALLAGSVALWKIWKSRIDVAPEYMAGHSLGEYSALVCAESIDFADTVKLVANRGQYMQQAVMQGEGSMAAILGLEDDKVTEICEEISGNHVVSAANYNSPGQVVIAGHVAAVEKAVAVAKDAGAKRSVVLPVSVPSHCALMESAADRLRGNLESMEIKTPAIPVIHNVDAKTRSDADGIRIALVEQLYRPVQWTRCMQTLVKSGISNLLECGPGKVLSGLNRRIDKTLNSQAMGEPDDMDKAVTGIKGDNSGA